MGADAEQDTYEGWAIVELMGHRRCAGKVTQATCAGVPMLRLDIYCGMQPKPELTQYYSGAALYALTPAAEEICRQFALMHGARAVAMLDMRTVADDAQYESGDVF